MIAGIFHSGSGIGNQLFRYITTRVLALDKGFKWGMCNPQDFKGDSFLQIDKGKYVTQETYKNSFYEKKIVEDGLDIRGYDPEINFVEDNTIIDGEFQDERYWGHRLLEIRGWLKTEEKFMHPDLCVINFRGGEYTAIRELFLPKSYWDKAIEIIKQKNPFMRFEVHTDDPDIAKGFFPDLPVVWNGMITADKRYKTMGDNWRALRYAKYAILSNSSFGILPSLLNEDSKFIIAPRYWARHNTKVWALPQNFYKKFFYI